MYGNSFKKFFSGLSYFGEWFFLMVLLVLHFHYFAIPAFRTYKASGVAVEILEEEAEHLPPPAVTVCPYKNYSGWKNASLTEPNYCGSYDTHCDGADTLEKIQNCIDTGTYNRTEALLGTIRGAFISPQQLPDTWIMDLTVVNTGKCFTFNYTTPIRGAFIKIIWHWSIRGGEILAKT